MPINQIYRENNNCCYYLTIVNVNYFNDGLYNFYNNHKIVESVDC